MTPGEIYFAHFPFGGKVGGKFRPVLALTDYLGPVPEVLVAYVTSIVPAASLPSDVIIDPADPDNAAIKLKLLSIVRLHKLATLHQSDVGRFLGKVSTQTWAEVEAKLRLLLNL